MIHVYPRVSKVSPELIETFRTKVSPSTIGHLTDQGFMKSLRSFYSPTKLVGTALTVRIPHLDSAAVHVAVGEMQPGDVLVVETSGDYQRACFGGGVMTGVAARKGAGAVIDGAITDPEQIRPFNLPVYYRQVSPLTTRIVGIEGEVNVPIAVDNVVVLPGDLILGDESGVMVVPRDQMEELCRIAAEKDAAEPAIFARIAEGSLLLADFSGAAKFVVRHGC